MRPPARSLTAIVLLYVASGMPFGLVMEFVPVYLNVHGASLEQLGALTLVGLPWTLRAIWSPLVDRYGTLKQWMMGALLLIAALTAVLPFLPVPSTLLVVALVALVAASATQDVAIDGYFANGVPEAQHGRANGYRVAAYRAAMAVVGGGAVVLGDQIGWNLAFGVVAVVMLGLVGVQGLVPAVVTPARQPAVDWFGALYAWVATPAHWAVFFFVLLYKLGDAAMGPMVKPFWLSGGLSASEVGAFSTSVGAILTAVGALLGGECITRYGLRRSFLPLAASQAASNLGYAAAALIGGRTPTYLASSFESLSAGLGTAVLLAVCSRSATGGQAATRFSVLLALASLTRTLAGAISGAGAAALGFGSWFTLTAVLAVPGLFLGFRVVSALERASGLKTENAEPSA